MRFYNDVPFSSKRNTNINHIDIAKNGRNDRVFHRRDSGRLKDRVIRSIFKFSIAIIAYTHTTSRLLFEECIKRQRIVRNLIVKLFKVLQYLTLTKF